ncbi:MAG: hypothetical protein HYR72_20735 [Deltaproteobacteria bacterium]|nr:hypothetical protein [Deltaproteobacteria bacterium]MBI3389318.1 hypothetical protein [Deltaproteobacteria bacterium]
MRSSEGSRLWRFLNSPIVVLAIGAALWPAISALSASISTRWRIAAAATELRALAENQTANSEGGSVKLLVSGFISQAADGFREAFSQVGNDHAKSIAEIRQIRPLLVVSEVAATASSGPWKEKIVGRVVNNADVAVENLNLCVMFFDGDGHLIDAEYSWLRDQQVVEPKQTVAFAIERSLGQGNEPMSELARRKSQRIDVQVANFTIVQAPRSEASSGRRDPNTQ